MAAGEPRRASACRTFKPPTPKGTFFFRSGFAGPATALTVDRGLGSGHPGGAREDLAQPSAGWLVLEPGVPEQLQRVRVEREWGLEQLQPHRPGHRARGAFGDGEHAVRLRGHVEPRHEVGDDLLKKVFAVDVLACPDCGGRLQIIAFISDDAVARRILLHLGLDSRGPTVARAQAPPDFSEPGPSYAGPDPVYAD